MGLLLYQPLIGLMIFGSIRKIQDPTHQMFFQFIQIIPDIAQIRLCLKNCPILKWKIFGSEEDHFFISDHINTKKLIMF